MSRPWPGYIMQVDGASNVPDDVILVQSKLGVWQTGVYGPTTAETVSKYQKSKGIGQTAQVGEQTWTSLFGEPEPPAGLGVNALSWAMNEAKVPVTEEPLGSNWGPRVSEYIASVFGPPSPCAWCCCGVYWSFGKEAAGRGVKNPMLQTGSCSQLYSWARDKGKLVTAPKQGDIFLCIGGDTGHYHTGFVAADPVNGYFETVEFNSNYDGSSNGTMVAHRSPGRSVTSCDYIRL